MQTKHRVSDEQRRQVLELRRRHSLREVAEATGLPLGTVKTLVSRSGAFRDNDQHRALFTLPPISTSTETLPSVPELPPQEVVTGDKEVDAVLWLRSIISTGQAALIDRAMEGARKIRTPLDVLEKRYRDHLVATNPGHPFAAMSSFGFADLEALATRAIEQHRLRLEGAARFGGTLLADTVAETFCIEALSGLEQSGPLLDFDKGQVADRFNAHPELLPHTLADCLYELGYWDQLYRLRNAVDRDASDGPAEATAREWFVFGLLAQIRPRDKAEALTVFRHLIASERDDMAESEAILCNLIG
ncbi:MULTISPECIES: sigma-70 region 4 domain-containing protein [Pseudomonas]|uniref:sigma-70 region 4 domain-containing protein n=1 Tax=Pseudomonas TaxID=286 RepID=UPI002118EA53|nr:MULTISPECIES: sigma-70 region 4 domain-containing protein [Pseudomonas]